METTTEVHYVHHSALSDSYFFGRTWFYIVLGVMLMFVVIIHAWWLPKKKGINGLTGESRDKYYELRGWAKK